MIEGISISGHYKNLSSPLQCSAVCLAVIVTSLHSNRVHGRVQSCRASFVKLPMIDSFKLFYNDQFFIWRVIGTPLLPPTCNIAHWLTGVQTDLLRRRLLKCTTGHSSIGSKLKFKESKHCSVQHGDSAIDCCQWSLSLSYLQLSWNNGLLACFIDDFFSGIVSQ